MRKIILIYLIAFGTAGCTSNELQETQQDIEPIKSTYCLPLEAEKLLGQLVLSEDDLKRRTNAGVILISYRGEPVSSDLRYDRLSIVINSELKIIYAACV
ncbi:hypothetical protein RMB03_19620 [Acinetobacter sp. V91_7]|uniref:hypothetical protein n=1 Tax=Acinetobacter TaxID=469 RepID=UPI00227470A7|nr:MULTISPECIES: hypothetical protein [Acinetobacter]MDS7930100.1 hypothetical protein [Acinetobacter sp. V102_4]MDS7933550.1 hypothetical protein [Acinetobacter sp. V91_4B]MDS7965154.1 hypothetical protein [Acinetobacter sp. V91_7]MDS8027639.1 hypothetical protein [Acinetobacter sp. V91_13]GLG83632.1 hypothetical protein ACSO1_21540 [Acinetobacter calcoaceticus]